MARTKRDKENFSNLNKKFFVKFFDLDLRYDKDLNDFFTVFGKDEGGNLYGLGSFKSALMKYAFSEKKKYLSRDIIYRFLNTQSEVELLADWSGHNADIKQLPVKTVRKNTRNVKKRTMQEDSRVHVLGSWFKQKLGLRYNDLGNNRLKEYIFDKNNKVSYLTKSLRDICKEENISAPIIKHVEDIIGFSLRDLNFMRGYTYDQNRKINISLANKGNICSNPDMELLKSWSRRVFKERAGIDIYQPENKIIYNWVMASYRKIDITEFQNEIRDCALQDGVGIKDKPLLKHLEIILNRYLVNEIGLIRVQELNNIKGKKCNLNDKMKIDCRIRAKRGKGISKKENDRRTTIINAFKNIFKIDAKDINNIELLKWIENETCNLTELYEGFDTYLLSLSVNVPKLSDLQGFFQLSENRVDFSSLKLIDGNNCDLEAYVFYRAYMEEFVGLEAKNDDELSDIEDLDLTVNGEFARRDIGRDSNLTVYIKSIGLLVGKKTPILNKHLTKYINDCGYSLGDFKEALKNHACSKKKKNVSLRDLREFIYLDTGGEIDIAKCIFKEGKSYEADQIIIKKTTAFRSRTTQKGNVKGKESEVGKEIVNGFDINVPVNNKESLKKISRKRKRADSETEEEVMAPAEKRQKRDDRDSDNDVIMADDVLADYLYSLEQNPIKQEVSNYLLGNVVVSSARVSGEISKACRAIIRDRAPASSHEHSIGGILEKYIEKTIISEADYQFALSRLTRFIVKEKLANNGREGYIR